MESSPDAFPLAIRHAPWFVYALIGAVGLGTIVHARARRQRAARRRVAAVAAAAAHAVPPARWDADSDAVVTVRGALRLDEPLLSVVAMGFADGRELVEIGARPAEGAAIEVDGVRVAIPGSIAITAATRIVRHHALPPAYFATASVVRERVKAATELHVWRGGVDAWHVRHLADGDEVVARGRLARVDDGWVLRPAAPNDSAAVEVGAVRGFPDPSPVPPQTAMGRIAGGAVVAAVIAEAALRLAGRG